MLLVQYMEDLSDRELERYLQENLAAKLFCDFSLESPTPDFSYFSKLRTKIGTKRARYQGIAKNQFQVFMQALAYNLKRLLSLGIKRVELVPV